MTREEKLLEILEEKQLCSGSDLERFMLNYDASKDLATELLERGVLSKEKLSEAWAYFFELSFGKGAIELKLPKELLGKLSYSFVKKHFVLPFAFKEGRLLIAISDPLNLDALDELAALFSCELESVYFPKERISSAMNEFFKQGDGGASQLIADMKGDKELEEDLEVYDLLDSQEQVPLVKLLNLILSEAINQGASDIHFEPQPDSLQVRYRIDGVLQKRHSPAQEHIAQLIARIKVMAKLDIAERRLPQDGRIKLRMGGREIDFRVSSVPTSFGERIVLRILDKGNVVLGLDQIGLEEEMLALFRKLVHLPEGIVLVTGPTGSGKTTTLYSALCELASSETNIMTIEDPVEYKIPSIAQMAVNPKIKLSFARGLRHILRQDPDIIMIGEIRDQETAEIAIQAALTGHFVLSTLHTNDAPSALTRLLDMGVEPYLLSSTVNGVIAQRLVRKLCPQCKESYPISEEERLSFQELTFSQAYKARGCEDCFYSGYKGRVGIYELMHLNESIKQQFIKNADAGELRKLALSQGMQAMRENALKLIAEGLTSISEVLRVTRSVDMEL